MEDNSGRADFFSVLTLMDDILARNFYDPESEKARLALQKLLQLVLGDETLIVKSFRREHELNNAPFRSVRLDIDAIAERGVEIRIEVEIDMEFQKETNGPIEQRVVHAASTMIVHSLKPQGDSGKADEELRSMRPCIVIVLMLRDHFRKNKPIYRFRTVSEEAQRELRGAPEYVFVNTSHKNAPGELAKLFHDYTTPADSGMALKEIADRMDEMLSHEEVRKEMSTYIQSIIAEKDRNIDEWKHKADEFRQERDEFRQERDEFRQERDASRLQAEEYEQQIEALRRIAEEACRAAGRTPDEIEALLKKSGSSEQ